MTDSTNIPAADAVTDAASDALASQADMTAGETAGQSMASDRIQLAQAVVEVPQPNPGETVTITVAPGQTVRFGFDYVAAGNGEVLENGTLVLPVNGGEVVLEGFAAAATAQPPVELTNSDGTVIELGDFLVAIDVPIDVLIDTAAGGDPAGPLPDTTAANQGAGFSPGNGPQILGSLDPDGPVDPTALSYRTPERENFLDDLDEDDDTPPDDNDVPVANDDGIGADPEAFCLDESILDGGEGGYDYDIPSATIVDGGEGGAPDGSNMAGVDAAAGYSVGQIEAFFGLGNGAIRDINPGETGVDGGAMKTFVTVQAGDELTFQFNFLQAEEAGNSEELDYMDYAVVVIGNQVFTLADNLDANSPGIFGFDEQTGFLNFSFTFTTSGTFQIGFAVLNEGDNDVDPGLLIDDVRINGVSVDSFEGGLDNWQVLQGGLSAISGNVLDNDDFGDDTPTTITGITYVGDAADVDVDTSVPGFVTFTSLVNNWTLEFNSVTGEYTFTLTGPYSHSAPGADQAHEQFLYTITDNNGDSDSATLTICIKDDVPEILFFGAEGGVTLDETPDDGDEQTIGVDLATGTFYVYSFLDVDYGADQQGAVPVFALTLSAPGADSGLVDAQSNQAILLSQEPGGDIVGTISGGTVEVFRISFNPGTDEVTVTQFRAVEHGNPNDPDESGTPESILANLVSLQVTVTDGDGDTDTALVDIGSRILFEDDGPSVAFFGAEGAIAVDESVGEDPADDNADDEEAAGAPAGAIGFSQVNFYLLYSGTLDPGSDGEKSVDLTLSIPAPGTDSGLDDTATGQNILLYVEDGVVVGRVGGEAGEIAFTIAIDADTDDISVAQFRAVEHDNPADHDEPGADAETIAFGAVSVTITVTDGDDDTASDTADLGSLIRFEDDGPTASFAGAEGASITVDETVGALIGDANAADELGSAADTNDIGFASVAIAALIQDNTDYGSDGPGAAAPTYDLGLSADGADSGLVDTESGESILLFDEGGIIVGRVGAADGEIAFTVGIVGGNVEIHQYRAVVHDDPTDGDEADSPQSIAEGVLGLTITVTDGDGDSDTGSVDLGPIIKFEDDGPTAEFGTPSQPILLDETDNDSDDGDVGGLLANVQVGLPALFPDFLSGTNPGSDGLGTGSAMKLVLSTPGADSGLVDTMSGEAVILEQLDDFTIVGRTAVGGEEVFRVTLKIGTGSIDVTQRRAVVHDDPTDPDEAGSPALITPGLINIAMAIVDGDGDVAADSFDLGSIIAFEDDGPTVTTAGGETTTVDEDDLPDGNDATPDSLTVSGDIGVDFGSDGPGDVSGISGPAGLFSNGVAIVYGPFDAATNTLVATAGPGGAPVFTVSIDPETGQYSFTLSGPIDHAPGSDNQAIEIDFTVTDGDGDQVDGSFTVNVTDDKAEAEDDTATVNDGLESVNVTIMFDRSGSMDEDPEVDGFSTRIDLARAAIASLLQAYDSVADVNILIVDFAGKPTFGGDENIANNSGWLTGPDAVQAAIAYMAGLDPDGNTDYSKAVDEAMSAYGNGTPVADESVVYFLSDGNPTFGGDETTHNLTDAQVAAWESFLTTNGIETAFAVGIGNGVSGVTNIEALEGVAFPNVDGDGNPVIVTDAGLIDALLITVSGSASGNVLDNDHFGADGEAATAITTLTYGLDEYEFDGTNITKNGLAYAPGVGTSVLVIVAAFGTLTFDFANGDYDYAASAAGTDTFSYTIVDGDGDESTASLVLNVGSAGVVEPDLVPGTDGNDDLSSNNDAVPDIIGGGDGNDKLEGGDSSNDLLIGGAGSDALFGNGGDDVLIGGSQSEVKASQPAPIRASDGADYLDGGDGHDILFGNEGDDILIVRSTDEAHGGSGNDLFVLHDNVNFGLIDGGGSLVDANHNEVNGPVSLAGTFKGDTLTFNGSLDLTAIEHGKIIGIETISMLDSLGTTNHSVAGSINHFAAGADTLTLDASDVISMGTGVFDPAGALYSSKDAIKIDGDANDTVELQGGNWTNLGADASTPGYNVWVHDTSGLGSAEDAYVLISTSIGAVTS